MRLYLKIIPTLNRFPSVVFISTILINECIQEKVSNELSYLIQIISKYC
jgi:hypothetical protein